MKVTASGSTPWGGGAIVVTPEKPLTAASPSATIPRSDDCAAAGAASAAAQTPRNPKIANSISRPWQNAGSKAFATDARGNSRKRRFEASGLRDAAHIATSPTRLFPRSVTAHLGV